MKKYEQKLLHKKIFADATNGDKDSILLITKLKAKTPKDLDDILLTDYYNQEITAADILVAKHNNMYFMKQYRKKVFNKLNILNLKKNIMNLEGLNILIDSILLVIKRYESFININNIDQYYDEILNVFEKELGEEFFAVLTEEDLFLLINKFFK